MLSWHIVQRFWIALRIDWSWHSCCIRWETPYVDFIIVIYLLENGGPHSRPLNQLLYEVTERVLSDLNLYAIILMTTIPVIKFRLGHFCSGCAFKQEMYFVVTFCGVTIKTQSLMARYIRQGESQCIDKRHKTIAVFCGLILAISKSVCICERQSSGTHK